MSLLERIYFFDEEIKNNRFPNAVTITDQFEVSLATARRDIAYLRDRLLAPIEFSQKKNGFFYNEKGFILPFENSSKILFLLGMLNKLAEEAGLSSLPEVKQLTKKLSTLTNLDHQKIIDSIHCQWIETESVRPDIFDRIIKAILSQKIICIEYQSTNQEITTRNIEPLKIINYQGRWYLFAYCTMRTSFRLFHIARIKEISIQKTPIKTKADTYLDCLENSFGIFQGEPRFIAKIFFTSTAAELISHQFWHKDQTTEIKDGGLYLSLPVSDDREIVMKILQYGSMATVISPPELKQRVINEIAIMKNNYE